METNTCPVHVSVTSKIQSDKPKENGIAEDGAQSDSECPHKCPSPKKGLAHAIVQCNIHLGRISDPRILPCGHSFCYRCLHVLFEEQKSPSHHGRPILVCPLCRRENHLESIESLTTNFAISDLLEIFDAEEKEEERIRRETLSEMEHTIGILKVLREKIQKKLKLDKCDPVYQGCLEDAIVATEKRLSYLDHLAQDIKEERNHDKKERLIRNLYFTCLAYQRLAEMSDGELQLSSNGRPLGSNEMQQFLEMYKNAIVLEYRPTETMGERRSRVWFALIFSTLIQQCWPFLESDLFIGVAKHLSLEFSKMFDTVEGAWICVVGRRPLGCWIWKDEHDYACLDVADYRLIIYRRDLLTKNALKGKGDQNVKKLHQTDLDKILGEAVQLKEKSGWQDLNIAKFVRERLQREFQGFYWHTAAGYKGHFALFASVKDEEIDLNVWTSQIGQWRAVVWEG